MVDVQQEKAAMATTLNMTTKNKDLLSNAMKRTSDWIFSHEIPSDVTVNVGGVSFSLHKFPLVSKCGYMRKLMSNSKEIIEIADFPGGHEGFEYATKFCYGINFELSNENIAMVTCVADYLEMTEEFAVGNLIAKTEAYLNEVGLKTVASAVSILKSSESLEVKSEKVKLTNRCIEAIAVMATSQGWSYSSGGAESWTNGSNHSSSSAQSKVEWWGEDLTVLGINMFRRVILAMISKGFKHFDLGPVLMLYAERNLHGLEIVGKCKKKTEPKQEHEKRAVLETIVSLLPSEKEAITVSFLSMLLRAAIYLETTMACRLDLEKRIGSQLENAVLHDILIPSFHLYSDTLFDVETVKRIMLNYLDYVKVSSSQVAMEKVSKLIISYFAEIASDPNLLVTKFIDLAEHIPEQERPMDDGMYRAIDIYLKAHPDLSEAERKKLCSLIDCRNLSPEACAHAAQNDRLSLQTVVQVLHYEQQRLKESIVVGNHPEELSSLEKENQDLKFELLKMKMRLKDIETISSGGDIIRSTADKPSLIRISFISCVSKKFRKLVPFLRADHGALPSTSRASNKQRKTRRYSVS